MPFILTLHQYKVLEVLAQRSQWRLKDIAQALLVSKSAACKCIQRLEKKGVIRKEWGVGDTQYMSIHITQDGEEAMKFLSSFKFQS
jgi:DNA-binding MarR family transcriptional regulator